MERILGEETALAKAQRPVSGSPSALAGVAVDQTNRKAEREPVGAETPRQSV